MRKSIFAVLLATLVSCVSVSADTVSNRITVTVRGKGPDVVLIPGLTCSSAVWDATAKRLEGHYCLHLVQVAGFAGSPASANAKGPIIQPTVDAIDAYIKTNKLKAPKVIGHSIGGLMGMMLALQHPEDVDKLMIVDSLPFFSVLFGANNAAAAEPQAAMMRDMTLAQSQEAYAQSEKEFIPSLVKSPEGIKEVTEWAVASDKSVVARAMYEDMTTDIRPQLSKIKIPVTLLYPYDPSAGFSQAAVDGIYQSNFAALPNKTLFRVDNSRHFIMLDQPEVFAARVDEFLK